MDLLNPVESSPPLRSSNLIQADSEEVDTFHSEITDQTSGLTVEQLEQVNSVLMDTLWRTRGSWDRKAVLKEMGVAFNEVMEDMRTSGQEFGAGSWERLRLLTQ
jgi:Glu-tRNA(Gln) amidotransferase subunit E-like FAD-binding protein